MSSIPATHVIQVTNVAPAATIDQMKELFGYLGRIRDIKLYPSESYILEPQSRVCYVEYYEKWSVGVAQHLTNTVFIDRALIVLPIADDGIPSESTALALTNPSSALPGLVSSGPNALINEISGVDGSLVITTIDPKLTALGLPQYPPLPANLDPVKIEEIRRTVTVGNLNPAVTAENLLKFVNQIGEVKFLRMSGDGIQVTKYALVEFTDQSSIPKVLQYNGVAFESRPLIINHSTTAIVKPLPKSSETAQKEIDEAMKRVREAQSLIAAVVEPELPEKERRRSRRSRSRSRSRYRSSSRSRRRRSRSRSKRSRSRRRSPHSRRRSRTPPKHSKNKSRSKSRERKKDASPRHKKERSQSRDRKKDASPPRQKKDRSRSHSRDRRKEVSSPRRKKERSRSRSRERKKVSSPSHKKERSRSHSRDRYKRNRSKSRSPSKSSSKSKSRKSKRSKEKVEKSRERTPKLEKNDKKDKSDERRSGSHNPDDRRSGSHHPDDRRSGSHHPDDRRSGSHHPDDRRAGSHHPDDRRSESQQHKENNQSNELYGPSLPVPESSSSFLEDSKSREQKFNSDMSLSPSSINTASVETSQNANNDPTFKKDMFGKNLSVFNKIDHDNILDSTTNTSQRTLTSDNTGILLNEGNDFISNMYCNRKDNCETMDSFHSRNSNTDLYEEIKGFGASGHLSIISENETTQNEDISAKFISKEEPNNNSFNKNDNCDILSALASSSTQSFSENPLGNSVISTFGLPCNNGEKDSANNSREPSNSIKSSVRCDKQRTSRSHSRSPSVVKRKKNKRSRSRSLSKEYSYSRKCKSRSTSKIRSPSRSYRRSRSRSKGSSRKASSPSRYNKIRNRSRSRSRSSKRKSYSPRRQYDSRRRNLSPKHHSSSSRKRSLTPRRKSRTPRRRSPTPHQKSRSPKHRSRSRSYKSQSPQRSKSRKYVRSRRTASKSPKRQSSSPSSSNLRLEQRKVVKENNKDKEFKSNPNFLIDGANIDSKVTLNYDEEDYNLEKMMEQKGHDNLEHLPINVENNYNCDYNSADMDLGSD